MPTDTTPRDRFPECAQGSRDLNPRKPPSPGDQALSIALHQRASMMDEALHPTPEPAEPSGGEIQRDDRSERDPDLSHVCRRGYHPEPCPGRDTSGRSDDPCALPAGHASPCRPGWVLDAISGAQHVPVRRCSWCTTPLADCVVVDGMHRRCAIASKGQETFERRFRAIADAQPQPEGQTTSPMALFHQAWGLAAGRPDYNKEAWKTAQAALEAASPSAAPRVPAPTVYLYTLETPERERGYQLFTEGSRAAAFFQQEHSTVLTMLLSDLGHRGITEATLVLGRPHIGPHGPSEGHGEEK